MKTKKDFSAITSFVPGKTYKTRDGREARVINVINNKLWVYVKSRVGADFCAKFNLDGSRWSPNHAFAEDLMLEAA